MVGPVAAGRRLDWLRPVHHRRIHVGSLALGPLGAPALSGRAHQLFRARPAIAPELPHRYPFRPPGEDHDHRYQHALEPLVVVLSRSSHQLRLVDRADAAYYVSL